MFCFICLLLLNFRSIFTDLLVEFFFVISEYFVWSFFCLFCKIVDFAVPDDHRIKLKECEKKDKYLDLARELKKLWNMQATIIPIVIGVFGTLTKGLLKGLEDLEDGGRVETIQNYWERPEYEEESWRLEETCYHSDSSEKPLANVDVKSSNEWIIIE